jgi:hypothetical protein
MRKTAKVAKSQVSAPSTAPAVSPVTAPAGAKIEVKPACTTAAASQTGNCICADKPKA